MEALNRTRQGVDNPLSPSSPPVFFPVDDDLFHEHLLAPVLGGAADGGNLVAGLNGILIPPGCGESARAGSFGVPGLDVPARVLYLELNHRVRISEYEFGMGGLGRKVVYRRVKRKERRKCRSLVATLLGMTIVKGLRSR